jgi:peptide-methionine (S)-S-oxide reductase
MTSRSSKLTLPTPADALPGRAQPMPVPERHFVTGGPLEPEGTHLAWALFGMGCFWGEVMMLCQITCVVSLSVL